MITLRKSLMHINLYILLNIKLVLRLKTLKSLEFLGENYG